MNRGWLLVLLISLGLNLGLGYRLWQQNPSPDRGRPGQGRSWDQGSVRQGQDHGDMPWRDMASRRLGALSEHLGLRPDQVDALRDIHERRGRLIHGNRKQIEAFRSELHEMMGSEAIDQPAVREAMQELGRRQARLDSLVTETVLLELEILEPEQRVRYRRMMPFERGQRQMGRRRFDQRPGGQ